MEEQNLFDPSSIAARSKREQYLKEADEYHLLRHIAATQKQAKGQKAVIPENRRQYEVLPGIAA